MVMVHGSAAGLDEGSLRDYLGRIMRGRTPTPEQVKDLRRRYEAIGGTANLLDRSREQAERLAVCLGSRHEVVLGAKHSPPFIADAVNQLAASGARRIVGIALAPHESLLTTGQYDEIGAKAAAEAGLDWSMVRSWHLQRELVALWAGLLTDGLRAAPERPLVLFSAHSLPFRPDDPYSTQVRETAEAVARAAGLGPDDWQVVFQSVPPGVDRSGWLGPNLNATFPRDGTVLVVPVGFVSDHLEILYDIDVQAREEAAAVGVEVIRTRMPNEDPRLARAMAAAVIAGD